MRARRLIEGAVFEPEKLRSVQQAFDQAWEIVAPTIGTDPAKIEDTRYKIAQAILAAASEGEQELEVLIEAGVLAVGVNYHAPTFRRN